ncbi:uncharacterized protein BDR25DRAFT_57157 [Lindgomyces ingoldianus]|uniref:Uncharacterized protein n=1 Tax=Lindgomyces ingoldianus TaxID=673940 RepID=A0ACB6QM09_9PLEO|nr:uncharacterized protein BDR25DRAFT_57157 [Lindgomyces ingoldianus]KAF2468049.1 hypothetical protein BDR25DRAFT_57157 [Lindgomyces ingoldianus]
MVPFPKNAGKRRPFIVMRTYQLITSERYPSTHFFYVHCSFQFTQVSTPTLPFRWPWTTSRLRKRRKN